MRMQLIICHNKELLSSLSSVKLVLVRNKCYQCTGASPAIFVFAPPICFLPPPTVFFWGGKSCYFWPEKPLKFVISARKSLQILAKTFFLRSPDFHRNFALIQFRKNENSGQVFSFQLCPPDFNFAPAISRSWRRPCQCKLVCTGTINEWCKILPIKTLTEVSRT